MVDRELMQQVLDALEDMYSDWEPMQYRAAEALRARLAQPEPEPVAWFSKRPDNTLAIKIVGKPTEGNWEPLYTAPPQREWQGLTDEEADEVANSVGYNPLVMTVYEYRVAVQKATEAKLKEKNT